MQHFTRHHLLSGPVWAMPCIAGRAAQRLRSLSFWFLFPGQAGSFVGQKFQGGVSRVGGTLAMSRALGDFKYKVDELRGWCAGC